MVTETRLPAAKERVWVLRTPGAFREYEVALWPSRGEPDSLGDMQVLVWELRSGQPEVRRVLLEVYAALRCLPRCTARGLPRELDDARLAAIADALSAAARSGQLVVRRREMRRIIMPIEGGQDVLGPEPEPTHTFIAIALVDQDGVPVANRPYRVIAPNGVVEEGHLDSKGSARVDGLDPGDCQIWCPYVAPHPQTAYVVKDGDHVSGVAESFGFDDFKDLWNDPLNADLRNARPDPHILMPGDTVTVPEVKAKPGAVKQTGAKYTFVINRSPLKLRLRLLDFMGKPISGANLSVAGAPFATDGGGLGEASLDKGARAVPGVTPARPVSMSPGGLNPSEDESGAGWRARLFNMGFLWDLGAKDGDDEMTIALQDFQAEHALPLSGTLDEATKSQLVEAYGC